MFRYIFLMLLLMTSVVTSAVAGESGDEALGALSQRLRDMGAYESDITLDMDGSSMRGQYRVSGDDYHIDMGTLEFWGHGDRRYEVSHKIEEIVITKAVEGDNMLLSNPTKAFDLVGQGFDIEIVEGAEIFLLTLTPKSVGQSTLDVDSIEIYLDSKELLPTKIVYRAGRDIATIEFRSFRTLKSSIPQFDASRYRRYDVVDLY